jgi:hypothetical protein
MRAAFQDFGEAGSGFGAAEAEGAASILASNPLTSWNTGRGEATYSF